MTKTEEVARAIQAVTTPGLPWEQTTPGMQAHFRSVAIAARGACNRTVTHESVWAAIETIALRNGLSVSGLAGLAGLDSTAFNNSKRHSSGRPRWPSTETVSKVLEVSGLTFGEFGALVDGCVATAALSEKE